MRCAVVFFHIPAVTGVPSSVLTLRPMHCQCTANATTAFPLRTVPHAPSLPPALISSSDGEVTPNIADVYEEEAAAEEEVNKAQPS